LNKIIQDNDGDVVMPSHIVKKTLRKRDFVPNFPWREFYEELGLDPIAPEIEIAILKEECTSH